MTIVESMRDVTHVLLFSVVFIGDAARHVSTNPHFYIFISH
jgi:hypothetical protein